jgi:hypothetical protein
MHFEYAVDGAAIDDRGRRAAAVDGEVALVTSRSPVAAAPSFAPAQRERYGFAFDGSVMTWRLQPIRRNDRIAQRAQRHRARAIVAVGVVVTTNWAAVRPSEKRERVIT